MARGNMIVTLVAQTKRFSNDLRNAGKSALSFGSVLKTGFGMALTAVGALAGAFFTFIPNLVRMAEESRKSERRLENIAKQMGVFGKNTDQVTERLSEYAQTIAYATGVDDELVRGAEAILLTFKGIAKTAGTVGGAFDRATIAAVDLAAAGFGDVESNAKQLGKALQDPVKGLTALRRAGVTFTEGEQKKIKALVEGNKLLEAQEMILSAIETQVGGTAEATASSMDKMGQRFEAIGEQLGGALIPAVDELAVQMGEWLDSVEGKKAIEDLTNQLSDFGAWITSPEGTKAVKDFANAMVFLAQSAISVVSALRDITTWLSGAGPDKLKESADYWATVGGRQDPRADDYYVPYGGNAPRSSNKSQAPITINFNTPVDSVSAGREIQRVLADFNRVSGKAI